MQKWKLNHDEVVKARSLKKQKQHVDNTSDEKVINDVSSDEEE